MIWLIDRFDKYRDHTNDPRTQELYSIIDELMSIVKSQKDDISELQNDIKSLANDIRYLEIRG